MRYENRYTRARVREGLSPADRRIFWLWAVAFPIVIAIGGLAGVAMHLGDDVVGRALAGSGFAGGAMILATWLLGGHFTFADPPKPRE